jgi:MYXO-CTERM domain-containing protein
VTTDPTGLSGPIGQLAIAAGLVASLVVLIWQWRRRR